MAEGSIGRVWVMRFVYIGMVFAILIGALLPLSPGLSTFAGPDLLLCLSAVWVIRKPDYVPTVLIASMLIFRDILLMQPPGLNAAVALLLLEFLRSREIQLRSATFPVEWFSVALLIFGSTLILRLALWIAVLPRPPLGHDLASTALTCLLYPVVAGLSSALFNVRKLTPAQVAGQVQSR